MRIPTIITFIVLIVLVVVLAVMFGLKIAKREDTKEEGKYDIIFRPFTCHSPGIKFQIP